MEEICEGLSLIIILVCLISDRSLVFVKHRDVHFTLSYVCNALRVSPRVDGGLFKGGGGGIVQCLTGYSSPSLVQVFNSSTCLSVVLLYYV